MKEGENWGRSGSVVLHNDTLDHMLKRGWSHLPLGRRTSLSSEVQRWVWGWNNQ